MAEQWQDQEIGLKKSLIIHDADPATFDLSQDITPRCQQEIANAIKVQSCLSVFKVNQSRLVRPFLDFIDDVVAVVCTAGENQRDEWLEDHDVFHA